MKSVQLQLASANAYGDIDLTRTSLSRRYVHVPGLRLGPICERLGIKYAPAIVGFRGSRKYGYRPTKDGVVVAAASAAKLRAAIELRQNNPKLATRRASVAARRERQEQEHATRLSRLGISTGSRTDVWLRRGEIDDDEAELIAAKTSYRHQSTDYDKLLGERHDRDMARMLAQPTRPQSTTWSEYLLVHDYDGDPIAEAIAQTLTDPQKAHPIWFAEAVIAVRRAGIPLETLTYERIRATIDDWRTVRQHE